METVNVTPVSSEAPANDNTAVAQEKSEGKQNAQGKGAESKDATKAEIKRLGEQDLDSIVTVKINGETKELPVREVIKLNQLENASQAKMQEAAKLMKQVQGVIQMAKNDPKAFLRETGIDPYDFAESTLAEKFNMMQMTPEQRKLLEYEQKVKQFEEREKESREAQEREMISRREAEEIGKLDVEIGDAWKESGLPKTKYMVAQIAARMLSASKQGKTLTAKDAAASVKADFVSSAREVISQLDAEAIQEILGKDILKKIREFDVKRVTGKSASQGDKGPAKAATQPPKTFKSEHERRKYLEEYFATLKD